MCTSNSASCGTNSGEEDDSEDEEIPQSLIKSMAQYARVFCRLGSLYQYIGKVVEAGVEWDLDREVASGINEENASRRDHEDLVKIEDTR